MSRALVKNVCALTVTTLNFTLNNVTFKVDRD